MNEFVYKTITERNEQMGWALPENPLFHIMHFKLKKNEIISCSDEDKTESISLTNGFYIITLKNIISGELIYGRTKYDCTKGTLFCTAPNQTITYKKLAVSKETMQISFHKDFLNGSPLFEKIKKYNFFNYSVNEALHVSPKEEKLIKTIFGNIKTEYHNNQDEFSKVIILNQLETLLNYIDRFYKRQFLNRQEINQALFTQFKKILDKYFETNQFEQNGIPKVDWIANQLGVSYKYMNDTIKTETGKTAVDQVNLYLIEEAKNLLLAPNASISGTAYKLGFEYPQYFSRLFKKKVGVSPKEYIENAGLN
ncbi:transcriptional regulator, AraC family [Formosa agariphila KMM 3901]|uniref:Transcriptional regulator, AraC family n=1 Tax=Formosa agariphila (strain DSM 15362 / KCTC 12365 / LMG 23005 / KMM 3901 / M-2Alg 35-1) TaxID=1347342 RepID=T2KQQ4_FORAG|nr:response regulator transcription factor [Formosa agariphila]CDF80823.1 transcriptional regulator, AraC family [Formosa agariphila KMM 3901]